MAWGQYALDNFGTVAEAVEALRAEPFTVIAPTLPNGKGAQLHLAVSDPTGDSAIFEYLGGKLVIHHDRKYQVMTNSPSFDQQLAIETYWSGVNPLAFLPGSISAADRFVRASFLINAIPKQADPHTIKAVPGETYENQAVAAVLGVMRSVSTPLGITHPDKPNLASTLWRTVYDQKNKVFYFDSATSPKVAMINETLAKQYWPHQNPLGQQIVISKGLGPEMDESVPTIIGVVADSHNAGLGQPPGAMVMVPITQVTDQYAASYTNVQPLLWVVRTRGDPHQLITAVTEQLRRASSGFPVAHVRTMDEVMGNSTARQSFNMLLLTIFSAVALLLAAIGIYGLMAYSVAQRTREMGIRMALGADRSAIQRLVVWHGMKLAIAGMALGIALALGLTHLIASFLFEVKPSDPAAFFVAPPILTIVALIAVWFPATRASRVDPMQALRME